ncbi:MAG: NADH:ubiquinone reductase (Na(+)-transporting) subunit F [Parachlamydiales bacterium]
MLLLQTEPGFWDAFTLIALAALAFVLVGLLLALMILFVRRRLVPSGDVKIHINDNDSLTKEVKTGQTLLSALTLNGIPIPSPCGGKATCKQCKVRVKEGGGAILETERSAFNRKEIASGWRLSCQCKVKNDISIEVPEDLLEVEEFTGTVLSNQNVATFIKELAVEIPQPIEYRSGGYLQFHIPRFSTNTEEWRATIDPEYQPDWEAYHLFGQELDFAQIPDNFVRAYSMASYPAEGSRLLFNIRIATPPKSGLPWGVASSYLFSLKAGDKVQMSGPYGESFMIPGDQELVFLIGGAGSSFGRSHILHLFHTEKTERKVTLWYGARSLRENIYQEEFEALDRDFPNFTYHLVLSEPLPEDLESGWPKEDPLKTGFVFKAFEEGQLKKMGDPDEALYYVCGPPLHNKAVMKLLDDYGVPRDNIVLDDFGS